MPPPPPAPAPADGPPAVPPPGPGATTPPTPADPRTPAPGGLPPLPLPGSRPPAPAGEPPAGPGPQLRGDTGFALGALRVPPVPPPPTGPGAGTPGPTEPYPGAEPAGEPTTDRTRYAVRHLGERPPTYEGAPGGLPAADPEGLSALAPDTVLDGARHGPYTLRAASVRGDSARYRGEPRRDFLLTARFGTGDDALVLIAAATADRAAPDAAEAGGAGAGLCRWVAATVGRSQERLGADIRAGRRDDLRSGLQRLTDRAHGRLRVAGGPVPAGLRCLLLPVDPECRTRVAFGLGDGGLFRLRDGAWQDLESPDAGPEDFRFRASVARPGDALLLCTGGLAGPMREGTALPAALADRWGPGAPGGTGPGPVPPGLAAFLADTTLRLKGYADDRTAAVVWES